VPLTLSARRILGLLAGLAGVQYFGARLGLWLAGSLGVDPSSGAPFLLATLGLPSAFGVAWVWFMAVWREPGGWAALGLTPLSPRWFRLGLLAASGCFLLGVAVAILATPLFGAPKGPPAPIRPGEVAPTLAFVVSFVLTGVLLAPFLEELVFRGVLFAWLRPRLGFWPAAAIAAILHALVHFDAGSVAPLTAIFVALAWLYERSGSLWTAAIAHGGHNLISMSLALAAASRLT
jgi:membrane protease YdiL (CAAX protease family)